MLTYISNTDHHKDVLSRVQSVKHMLWIGTADMKDLCVVLVLIAQLICSEPIEYLTPFLNLCPNSGGFFVYCASRYGAP